MERAERVASFYNVLLMKNTRIALSTLLLCAAAGASAQSAPASPWTVTGNAGLFSEYRFRGISQTDTHPAIQGGIDIAHASGLYIGNWNSNVDSGYLNGANIEMDFYGGYKKSFGALGLDVGAIHYYYPGSGRSGGGRIKNTEIYIGGTYGPLGLKHYRTTSDFFSIPNTKRSAYTDLSLTHDLGSGIGLNAHVGYQKIRNAPAGVVTRSIVDWKVGATYDLKGWLLGASYIDTNRERADGGFFTGPSNKDLAKATLVVSVGKTF